MTSAFFTSVKYETISKISPSSTYLSMVGPTCTHLFHLQKPKNYLMRSGGEAIYRLHPHSRQYVGGAAGLLSCLFFCLSPFKFLWFRPAWSSMDEPKMKKWWNPSYQTQTQLNSTQHMWDEIHHFETTILTHNQKSNPSGTFVGSSAFPRDWGGVGIEKVNLILWIHMASWIITQHLISWNHNCVSNIPRKQTSKTIIFHN